MNTDPPRDPIAELARQLDCFTEADVQALASAKPGTVEAWRKRGTGPAYILFGNTFLYPREPLKQFLHERVRQRARIAAKEML